MFIFLFFPHSLSSLFVLSPSLLLGAVPTAPPQNVQVEAVNSTTIRFLWNPPPQQFINGINQGYKVRAIPKTGTACGENLVNLHNLSWLLLTEIPDFNWLSPAC